MTDQKTMTARLLSLAALLPAAALFGACPSGDGVLCGEDTRAENGACVSTLVPVVCGPGTSLDEATGECRPLATCGPGTVYNASARECVPEATCGEGTELDPSTGQCLPLFTCGDGTTPDPVTGDCLDTTQCGEGTTFDDASGECVPVDNCGTGTTYHPLTHLCTPDVVCGPGLFASAGVCLSEDDILAGDADATESVPDMNDPAYGGSPETLVLEPVGDSLIFTGVIGRPVDLDGDDVVEQDIDQWTFDGVAGQYLRIKIFDAGLPQPAFRLEGPEGYVRTSRLGVVSEPEREVVLPYDGPYVLTIAPVAVIADPDAAPLIGDPDFAYIGVVEEVMPPTPQELVPGGAGETVSASGQLLGLDDNFFALSSTEPAGLLLSFEAEDVATVPALLLFSPEGVFLEEVVLEEDDDVYALVQGAWASAAGALLVVVDWQTSLGFDISFDVDVSRMTVQEVGAVGLDETLAAPRVEIEGLSGQVFAFDAPAGQVLTSVLLDLNQPQATLVGPSGVIGTWDDLDRDTAYAVTPEAGTYRWLAVNRDKSDVWVGFSVTTTSASGAGTFDLDGDVAFSATGDDLSPGRYVPDTSWTRIDVGAPLLLEVQTSFLSGMPDFILYQKDPRGRLHEIRDATEEEPGRLRAIVDAAPAELYFLITPVAIEPPNPPVREWTLMVQAGPVPPVFDAEPNDTVAAAQLIESLPAHFTGTLLDNLHDVYRLEPSPALGPGEYIEVRIEALDTLAATRLRIKDLLDEELYSVNTRRQTRWRLFAHDGPGPFFLDFEGNEDDFEFRYVVDVERVTDATELEPNDVVAAANPIPTTSFPYRVVGQSIKGEPDVFTLDVPAPLAPGQNLRVRLHNDADVSDLNLAWIDDAGQELKTSRHEDAVLFIPLAATETVRLRVEGNSTSGPDLYELSVSLQDDVEQEPNDDFVSAHVLHLGASPVRVVGQDNRNNIDTYRVDLLAPASPDEHLSVRFNNELERGDFQLRLYEPDGTETFYVEDYAAEAVHPLPAGDQLFFTIVPDGFSSTNRPDSYAVEVARNLGPAEQEPNDDIAGAQDASLPLFVQGQSNTDDPDVYRVTLATALDPAETIRVRASSLHDVHDLTVKVLDLAGTVVATFENNLIDTTVLPPDLNPGEGFYVEVRSTHSATGELTRYSLEVLRE